MKLESSSKCEMYLIDGSNPSYSIFASEELRETHRTSSTEKLGQFQPFALIELFLLILFQLVFNF